jgi:hypothetical protein
MDISFPDEPDINFELGGLANVLKSLGLVNTTRFVSKFLGTTKFLLKFTQSSNMQQLKPSLELRKKTDISELGVMDLIENTSDVMLETADLHKRKRSSSSPIKRMLNKKSTTLNDKNGAEYTNDRRTIKSNPTNVEISYPENHIGKIKIGLNYVSENEELLVTVYEAKGLERPPSTDVPNAQIQILLGKHQKKVRLYENWTNINSIELLYTGQW